MLANARAPKGAAHCAHMYASEVGFQMVVPRGLVACTWHGGPVEMQSQWPRRDKRRLSKAVSAERMSDSLRAASVMRLCKSNRHAADHQAATRCETALAPFRFATLSTTTTRQRAARPSMPYAC